MISHRGLGFLSHREEKIFSHRAHRGHREKCLNIMKMESKEHFDILGLAADTIIKWYQHTHTTMSVAIKPASGLDVELMGILLAAKKQTLGTLTTLANKHILSTHALLRVLVENFVVLAWALRVSASEENPTADEVYKRLRSWDYTRLGKDKALLEDLPRTPGIESLIEKAKADIDKLQKEGIRTLPNYAQLFRDLGGNDPDKVKKWMEIYARFYRQYSRAVHLNRNVTQKLVRVQNEDGKPKAILHQEDIEPDGDELLNIASISSDINKTIRDFYGWQSDAMQVEYEQLKLKLVKK